MAAPARLTAARDIRAVFDARNAVGTSTCVVHAVSHADAQARVAVVAGRKVGGAVQRNRAKRRLRSALQQIELPGGVDLVITAKPGAVDAGFDQIVLALERAVGPAARRAQRQ